jgi:hypothetical protein
MQSRKRLSSYTGGYNYGTLDQPFDVPLAECELPSNMVLVDGIRDICDIGYSTSDEDASGEMCVGRTPSMRVAQESKRLKIAKSRYESLINKFGSFSQVVLDAYNAGLFNDISEYRSCIDALFCNIDHLTRPLVQLPFKKDRFAPLARDALDFGIYVNGLCPMYRRSSGSYRANCKTTNEIICDKSQAPMEMPSWMIQILCTVEERLHLLKKLNHVVIHRYVDNKDKIGFHHDKDLDLDPDGVIVTISIGESRRFAVRDVYNTKKIVILSVSEGDVICMTDAFNSCFKHSLLPESLKTNIRYSITARCVRTHVRV